MGQENDAFVASGSEVPLPIGADKFAELTKGISPAGKENASIISAVFLGLASFVVLFLPLVAIFFVDSGFADTVMFLSFIGFFILIIAAVRQGMLVSLNKVILLIRSYTEELLVPEEQILGICVAKKAGVSLWLSGISKNGLYVFTTHRLFFISFKSALKSFKKALQSPDDNVKAMICDLGTRGRYKIGGAMFPPGLHLFAKKISIIAEGSDKEVSMAAFIRFGQNARAIKTILNKL